MKQDLFRVCRHMPMDPVSVLSKNLENNRMTEN